MQDLVCERVPERSNACAIDSEQGIGVGPTIKLVVEHSLALVHICAM